MHGMLVGIREKDLATYIQLSRHEVAVARKAIEDGWLTRAIDSLDAAMRYEAKALELTT